MTYITFKTFDNDFESLKLSYWQIFRKKEEESSIIQT